MRAVAIGLFAAGCLAVAAVGVVFVIGVVNGPRAGAGAAAAGEATGGWR